MGSFQKLDMEYTMSPRILFCPELPSNSLTY